MFRMPLATSSFIHCVNQALSRYRETRNHAAVVRFTSTNCSTPLIDTVTIDALQCMVMIDKRP